MESRYPELFKPFKIGKVEIKNKVVMSPMLSIGWFEEHSVISDKMIDYYVERAKGGVGAVFTCGNVPDAHLERCAFTISPFQAPERFVTQVRKLTKALHQYDTKLFVQIWFGLGRVAFSEFMEDQPVAVSEGPNRWKPEVTCRAMTTQEIYGLIDAVVEGAKLIYEAGADGIDINGAYGGYMGDQFTTDVFNHRTDEFGGSMDGQLRVLTEIVKRIKKETAQDYPVTCRLGTKHYMRAERQAAVPGEVYQEYGRDVEESVTMAKKLEEAGYDAFLMGNGAYDSFHWLYPPMYHKEGLWLDDFAPLTKEVHIPVIGPGKILRPEMANDAIAEGKVTAVAIGRALLADPQWVNKAAAGKPEDIRPCIGCNAGCIGRIFAGQTMLCAVNADLFREAEQALIPAEKPRKIAVIGGGVGGMETARIAAKRGHDVTIYEKGSQLGGTTLAANVPDYKDASRRLLTWFEKEIRESGVKVELNRELTAAEVKALGADAVVVSTGAHHKIPNIPGVHGANVTTAVDMLLGKAQIGQKVVVVGGGQVGCEVAYELLRAGKQVSLVEFLDRLMAGGTEPVSAAVVLMLEDLLNYHHADIRLSTAVKEIKLASVLVEKAGVTEEIPADTVVLAAGFVENNGLFQELKDMGQEVYLVGDAKKSPGNIMHAVADGNKVGREI